MVHFHAFWAVQVNLFNGGQVGPARGPLHLSSMPFRALGAIGLEVPGHVGFFGLLDLLRIGQCPRDLFGIRLFFVVAMPLSGNCVKPSPVRSFVIAVVAGLALTLAVNWSIRVTGVHFCSPYCFLIFATCQWLKISVFDFRALFVPVTPWSQAYPIFSGLGPKWCSRRAKCFCAI